ncbi:HNH endonuclease [Candidatus Methylacidiphilum infernorum]|uniref:HNH endonuclease n=2 Tax=Candidatus Methylacidiphilum infernorum TaxID=511746 RepID=A0ABX7PUP0_9BACT|nr:HNH endonuclease [Candidatus Methylacidiphilum infernorum]
MKGRCMKRRGFAVFYLTLYLGLLLPIFSSFGFEDPVLPDPQLTPGDTFDVTKEDICVPGYAKRVRDVPPALKRKVYLRYGILNPEPHHYEIDHLIPLGLGGSNSIKNLWPQSYWTSPWNAYLKDKLEYKLHKLVCLGIVDLKEAQQAIATNWIEAYKKYMGIKLNKDSIH